MIPPSDRVAAPGKKWAQHFITLWIFATAAFCAGMLNNQVRDRPMSLVYQDKRERLNASVEKLSPASAVAPQQAPQLTPQPLRYVELAEFQELAKAANTLVVDARPEIFHRLGHIPRALALPRDEFETYYAKSQKTMEAFRAGHILIYCNGAQCEDSHLVAQALERLQYTNVVIFRGGWSEWVGSGLPEEKL